MARQQTTVDSAQHIKSEIWTVSTADWAVERSRLHKPNMENGWSKMREWTKAWKGEDAEEQIMQVNSLRICIRNK